MAKNELNRVQKACRRAINILRKAQDVASAVEWRRLQHAISRVALTAGVIRPVLRGIRKRNRKPKAQQTPTK